MARGKWAIYNAEGTPVMLVSGVEQMASGNMPEGGSYKAVGDEVSFLEDVAPLEKNDAEAG